MLTVKKKNGEIEVLGDSPIETPDDGKLLAFINALQNRLTSPVLEELPPMHSGIMGYVGYDLIREIEDLPNTPHDDLAILTFEPIIELPAIPTCPAIIEFSPILTL